MWSLFLAYWVSRHPELFCAIASYSGELAYALSKDLAAVANWLTPQRGDSGVLQHLGRSFLGPTLID